MIKLITTQNNLALVQALRDNGADEVVIALKDHSFTSLPACRVDELVKYQPCSVVMNRLYSEKDLHRIDEAFNVIKEFDVMHIYFADPAMLYHAKKHGLLDRMIYRPETLVTNSLDAKWWKDRGIAGVSISPLLTMEEVLHMANCDCNPEVTVHGRMIMSISRRKLLEAYMKHNDFDVEVDERYDLRIQELKRDGLMPIYENEYGTIIYSDFVQESFEAIAKFKDTKVERIVINTVFMSDEEAIETVKAYRAILDGANVEEVEESYRLRFKDMEMSSGYYGQKTIL